jgi:UDP-glucose:(heptosyl)LPS alpha-1,3-glucosyltransferase
MRLAIVTPSVSRRAGTEKCVSWLIEDLSRHCDLTLFTGEVIDTDVSRCRVHRLPTLRRPRLLAYLTFLAANTLALALHRVRRRPNFDVVLATGGDCVFADVMWAHFCCAAWLALLRRGEVTLPTATLRQRLGALHYRAFLWTASKVEQLMYRKRRTRAIMAVSRGTRADLVHHYRVDPARVTVVPNAADDRVRLNPNERLRRRGEVRARHQVPDTARVLLFVAAGDWKRKGLLLVVQALAILADPSVHLMVVGKDDVAYYQTEARRLGIDARVHFAGFTPEVENYYAAADVFVYPSRYEAFSLVTLEAVAAGLPLLVTRINGVEELLRQGENGFLVRPDPEDIAAGLRFILADASRLEDMSAAARASSLRFTRSSVLEQTLRLGSSLTGSLDAEAA